MTRARRLGQLGLLLAAGFAVGSPACGESERPPVWVSPRDAGSDDGDGDDELMLDACVEDLTEATPLPLDLYVMLDISGSMLDPTATGESKWEAVTSALTEFVTDPRSSGLGVGIQYFPLQKEGVPESCSSDEECGDGGPCYLKLCWNSFGLVSCDNDGDCGDDGPCVDLAVCAEEEGYVCEEPGTECLDQSGQSYGTCTLATASFCVHSASCLASDYAAPAVAIGMLPDLAEDLVASIGAQEPDGATPTGPALAGALEQAGLWAREHPERSAAAVLVTDGLPTECEPVSIEEVAGLAADGLAGEPRIPTFVIGVFSPVDGQSRQNLGLIARAGGSKAFYIDTSGEVTTQLLEALDTIRQNRVACEFRIPDAPSGEAIDYRSVNVQVTNSDGSDLLYYVASSDECGKTGGWHYDTDPASAAPTKVVLCPASCESLQGDASVSVELALGCSTIVR